MMCALRLRKRAPLSALNYILYLLTYYWFGLFVSFPHLTDYFTRLLSFNKMDSAGLERGDHWLFLDQSHLLF